jgi:hypothetical protein
MKNKMDGGAFKNNRVSSEEVRKIILYTEAYRCHRTVFFAVPVPVPVVREVRVAREARVTWEVIVFKTRI